MLSTPDRPIPDPVQNEAFVGRIFEALIGALELFAIYLGHRLGFYDALREGRSFTAPQMYVRSLADRRQVLEWLEQQAAAGILMVEDALWHGPPPAGQPPRDRWSAQGSSRSLRSVARPPYAESPVRTRTIVGRILVRGLLRPDMWSQGLHLIMDASCSTLDLDRARPSHTPRKPGIGLTSPPGPIWPGCRTVAGSERRISATWWPPASAESGM